MLIHSCYIFKVPMKWNFSPLFYSRKLKSMLHWFIIFEFGLQTSTYGTYSAQAQSNSPACEGCFRQFCHRIYIGCHQVDVYGSYMRDRPFVSVGSSIPTAVWVGAISQFFSLAKHPGLFSCSSSHLAARSFPYHLFSMTSVFCHSSEAFEVPLDLISRYNLFLSLSSSSSLLL